MGFNKLFLPELNELETFLETHGPERFHERWCIPFMKRDAVLGPEASFDFIKQFLNREYNNSNSSYTGNLEADKYVK